VSSARAIGAIINAAAQTAVEIRKKDNVSSLYMGPQAGGGVDTLVRSAYIGGRDNETPFHAIMMSIAGGQAG
jgi:hypothetical protein